MSPDSADGTPRRKLWRIVSCAACVLAAISILTSVLLFEQVQTSRHSVLVFNCRDTNQRNRAAIAAIDDLIRREGPKLPPRERKQLPQARANNVFIFSRVLPVHRDCSAYADHVLHTEP